MYCQPADRDPAGCYSPCDPEQSILFRVLLENLETFLARRTRAATSPSSSNMRCEPSWTAASSPADFFVSSACPAARRNLCVSLAREGRFAAVTFIQRFGGSANLNLRMHMICIDGVYAPDEDDRVGRPATGSAPPQNRTCGLPAYGSSKRV